MFNSYREWRQQLHNAQLAIDACDEAYFDNLIGDYDHAAFEENRAAAVKKLNDLYACEADHASL